MVKNRPGRGQRTVLHLEPKRAAATIGYSLMALLAVAVVVVAFAYRSNTWPHRWRLDTKISERAIWITVAVAGFIALLLTAAAIVNGRRWHIARVIERLSNNPTLAPFFPDFDRSLPRQRAATIPPLDIHIIKPRKLPRPRGKLRRVTLDRNVVGHRPLQIAYLRLFENQPRMRTFIQGAWREFGYAHLLRSAASVTPAEYRRAKKSGDIAALFVSSREQLLAELDRDGDQPKPKGRYTFEAIGARRIRVRDRYGSYPVRSVLCHGSFWKEAVDVLLDRVDLVGLDLSGLTAENLGTWYELQHVVDRFPIERVVFLADQRSNRKFLTGVLQEVWLQMAERSPNAVPTPKVAMVVVTDYYAQSQSAQSPQGQSTQVHVRLAARRRQTRRVVSAAQDRIDGFVK